MRRQSLLPPPTKCARRRRTDRLFRLMPPLNQLVADRTSGRPEIERRRRFRQTVALPGITDEQQVAFLARTKSLCIGGIDRESLDLPR